MLERGATLQARRGPRIDLGKQLGPLAGLAGTVLVLAVLARTVGIGGAGWLVGLACGSTLNVALSRALWRDASARLGWASWVTLTRATLAVGVAALTAASFERLVATATLVAFASVALALDFVDGWIARRTATQSALGAKLDGEVDAFLILVLSLEVAPTAGPWVLLIGLARYAFLAAGWGCPWLRAPLPRRDWRKTVTASQGVALVVAASGVAPLAASRVLLAVALAMLAESFGRDVWWLWRHRDEASAHLAAARVRHPATAAVQTLPALAVVWAALVFPIQPWDFTLGSFARLPLEGFVVVGLAVALPTRARRAVVWLAGPLLGVIVLIKVFDLGFFTFLDRPFNPVEDWAYLSIGQRTVRDTFGIRDADLAVEAVVVIGLTAFLVPALALGQLTRSAARHRRRSLQAVGALTVVWALCWVVGVDVSGLRIASTSAAQLAVDEVQAVRADYRDQARFNALLARKDPYANVPPNRLLEGLRGKDILLVFVESYGQMAVQGTSFSPAVDEVVDGGTQQLAADGFSSVSGWLSSPTYGGGSWLAHATLQSGAWITSPHRFARLTASKRLTLASAFRSAGWKTVAEVPATYGRWPDGHSFYHYGRVWDRANLGYRGPKYGWSPMPDQWVLQQFAKDELIKRDRRPVFSEIDLTSSHEPWTRIPSLISWNRLGNGSIFNRLPVDQTGLTDTQQGYGLSIRYALRALYSFIERYGNKNTVLIVLGDHQPSRVTRPTSHEVPTTIIAHDPKVIGRLSSWGWTDGMLPSPSAPVWLMSAFRNRFFNAFDH
ncbi:MAG TPA: CDP-alcohol phosphatidyltransferase family protein [Gaiellaceae bacterium]|nr:CDP-alcohol phosphatidyltransferase family protein [Gaiellaceae bacterium]